jgi:hypothetical protein
VALFRKTQRTPTLGPKKRGTQEAAFAWTARNYTSIETPIQKISIEVSKSGKNSQSLSLKCKSTPGAVPRSRKMIKIMRHRLRSLSSTKLMIMCLCAIRRPDI